MKTTIYTLQIGNYEPDIRALTYPLMKMYAQKIGANFFEITERKFPDWPVCMEKLQIYELGLQHDNDWNIYLDADVLVHPDFFDVTTHLPPYTVMFNGKDMVGHRFRMDRHFRRDGRHLGACDWCAVAPADCIDLWHPPYDITFEEAVRNIFPVVQEAVTGLIPPAHLMDDYIVSRNIARYGLRHTTLIDIARSMGFADGSPWLWHQYNMPVSQKLELMNKVLGEWRVQIKQGAAKQDSTKVDGVPGSHIEGWMKIEELEWLANTAAQMQSVVEIGAWKGRSTFALCSSCPNVTTVDHFQGSQEHLPEINAGLRLRGEFDRNVGHFKNLKVLAMDSKGAAKHIESADMIFIDGAHDLASVREDLKLWGPKARKLIAGHDFDDDQISIAVKEYFGKEPTMIRGRIWAYDVTAAVLQSPALAEVTA